MAVYSTPVNTVEHQAFHLPPPFVVFSSQPSEKWIDFMLSPIFQEDMPLQMFVFPVNKNAKLEEGFIKHLSLPSKTSFVDPKAIASNRERWINEWTETVLR